MIKATFKNIAVSMLILSLVIVVLTTVDRVTDVVVTSKDTFLRVSVLDLNDKPVSNAKVTVGGEVFFTDSKGLSQTIRLKSPQNSYDNSITDWYTVNVSVQKEGFVAAMVFNCVVYEAQTRRLTVRLYAKDSSNLPYVCYVESPPADYIKSFLTGE